MKIFNGFKARVFLVLLFVFLVFLYIIGHLFYVQIVKGNEWKETGERQYKSEHVIKSKRGKIITNDEEILAYDGESYSITLDPTLVILENTQSVEDYKAGKSNALKYIVGQAMKLSKGKANPQMINKIILEKLS